MQNAQKQCEQLRNLTLFYIKNICFSQAFSKKHLIVHQSLSNDCKYITLLSVYHCLNFIWQLASLLYNYFIRFNIVNSAKLIKSFLLSTQFKQCDIPYTDKVRVCHILAAFVILRIQSTVDTPYVRLNNTHILFVHFHLRTYQKINENFLLCKAKEIFQITICVESSNGFIRPVRNVRIFGFVHEFVTVTLCVQHQ